MPGKSRDDELLPAPRARRPQDALKRFDERGTKEVAVEAALDRLVPGDRREYPDSPDRIVTAVRRLEALPAQFAAFPDALDARLRTVLVGRGLEALYTHQADAVAHALAGRHVVVTTPTASG